MTTPTGMLEFGAPAACPDSPLRPAPHHPRRQAHPLPLPGDHAPRRPPQAGAGAVVRFAGRRARTGSGGRAGIVRRLRRSGRYRARATKAGMRSGSAWVRVLPRREAMDR